VSFRLTQVCHEHSRGCRVLDRIDLSVEAGERIAVIGPSGAGKTTLLRVLGTALLPTAGVVEVLGTRPWQLGRSGLRRLRARIGMVHQAPPLPPRQRVVTAVLAGRIGAWPLWRSMASLVVPLDVAGATAALVRMDVGDKVFERCGQLSGGQLQRVGVARVLYQAPDLLLADEPVSAVDPALSGRVIEELMREALQRRATLVASLHAVDLALRHFPRIVGIRGGRIVFDCAACDIDARMLEALYAERAYPGAAGSTAGAAPCRPPPGPCAP
jgi:phosphonate transport system ATP-binding protein